MSELQPWLVDLQLFADDGGTGEKTEKATPRRRQEARRKGQVFKSTDLNAAIIMVAGTAAIYLSYPNMIQSLQDFTSLYLLERTSQDFTIQYTIELLREVLYLLAQLVLPIMATCFVAALLITYLQVGFIFSGEPLTPKLERLNPVQGFQRIFSKRALVELTKSLLKVVVTGWIVYSVIRKYYYIFPRFVDMELVATLQALALIIFEMAMKVGIFFIVIGVLDFIYQWYEHEKTLKMSKYDVKQEYKETEGDPIVKSRQRQIQREAAMRRMIDVYKRQVDEVTLGQNKGIILCEVGEKVFAVGVTDHNISVLFEVTHPKLLEEISMEMDSKPTNLPVAGWRSLWDSISSKWGNAVPSRLPDNKTTDFKTLMEEQVKRIQNISSTSMGGPSHDADKQSKL